MTTLIPKTISSRPWLWIILLFVILIAVWAWFITLAVQNQPQEIKIPVSKVHD
ncbi:hypothetical protein BH11VER1_BH11VER1_35610 [soil metagenome]